MQFSIDNKYVDANTFYSFEDIHYRHIETKHVGNTTN